MSHQLTFADSEFSTKRRQTRKEIFLSRMEQILPWQDMTAVIEPFYPKAGNISDARTVRSGFRQACRGKRGKTGKALANHSAKRDVRIRWIEAAITISRYNSCCNNRPIAELEETRSR